MSPESIGRYTRPEARNTVVTRKQWIRVSGSRKLPHRKLLHNCYIYILCWWTGFSTPVRTYVHFCWTWTYFTLRGRRCTAYHYGLWWAQYASPYYARPVREEALSDAFVWRLSDVCRLHRANSRTERPRKTKIGTELAHVTRDSDTTFKVKRSKVKVTRPVYSPRRLCTGSCSGQRGNAFSVGNCCYVAICRRGGRLGGVMRTHGRRWVGAYRVATRTAC